MKMLMVRLTGLGLAALASEPAAAASPAYCALYAREYANQMVQEGAPAGMAVRVQDQAYDRCLNQDDDPALPTASAYFGADVDGQGGSLEPISQGDISEGDEVAAPARSAPAATKVAASTQRTGRRRGSGLAAWTPEWAAWCAKHFPNSFDPQSGTIVPYKTYQRRFCD